MTVHARPVTSLTGPVHGTAYLVVITVTALLPGVSAGIPGGVRWSRASAGCSYCAACRGVRVATGTHKADRLVRG
ncbi:hypothetical protein ACFVG9_39045, partial [Saccharothrix carnea]